MNGTAINRVLKTDIKGSNRLKKRDLEIRPSKVDLEVEVVQSKEGDRWQEVRTRLKQEEKRACHSSQLRGMEV